MSDRRADEDRDQFISRCISELSDEKPDMTDEQKQAICISKADMSVFGSWEEVQLQIRRVTLKNNDGSLDMRYKKNKE
jgi:hypothetical protein